MKLKICGLKNSENINEIVNLSPDFMGFIFYSKSPRFIDGLNPEVLRAISKDIKKVGVFVKASLEDILNQVMKYGLDVIQLHGDEPLELAEQLKQKGLTVIKVFRVMDKLPTELEAFDGVVDYFLFDTKTKEYGGSGHQFEWSILEKYELKTPYLLSGGISLPDIDLIKEKNLPGMIGIDVNSRFEIKPGMKNIELLKALKQKI